MPDWTNVDGKRNFWLSEDEVNEINWALGFTEQNYSSAGGTLIQAIDWDNGSVMRERTDKEKLDIVIAKVAMLETCVNRLNKDSFGEGFPDIGPA